VMVRMDTAEHRGLVPYGTELSSPDGQSDLGSPLVSIDCTIRVGRAAAALVVFVPGRSARSLVRVFYQVFRANSPLFRNHGLGRDAALLRVGQSRWRSGMNVQDPVVPSFCKV
jgi:hypothetical protein